MKKIKVKKSNNFYWYIILGICVILISILIAPFWAKIKDTNIPWANLGMAIFLFLLAATLFVYVFKVLIYKLKVKNQNKVVKILTAVEFSIMILVAVLCILFGLTNIGVLEFKVPAFLDNHLGTIIVGFTMWIRGFVEIFGAYYYEKKNNNTKEYPVWYLLINIGLISFGPMFIFNKSITDDVLLYIYASLIFVAGVFSIVYGCLSKPVITEKPVVNNPEEIKKEIPVNNENINNNTQMIESKQEDNNTNLQIENKDSNQDNQNSDDIIVE